MAGTAVITEIAIEKIATFICKSPRIVGQLPLEMVIGGTPSMPCLSPASCLYHED
jgi:hypothetical protein